MPVGQGDQFLGAVGADPDQDQQVQPFLLEVTWIPSPTMYCTSQAAYVVHYSGVGDVG